MARRAPPARRIQNLNAGCAFGACGECMACFGAGDGPPSPCVKVCVIDAGTGWCVGCGRTGVEIGDWMAMSAPDKRDLLMSLPQRLDALGAQGKRKYPPAG